MEIIALVTVLGAAAGKVLLRSWAAGILIAWIGVFWMIWQMVISQ